MKPTVRTLLCLLLSACMILALAACGAEKTDVPAADSAQEAEPAADAPTADTSEFKTMADAFAYDSDNNGFNEQYYVYVFEKDGIIYRATAELPADVSETIWALDFFDENYDTMVREAVAPLEITNLENLTETIPSQEELEALVGKNGQELLDEGWTFWYWNLEDMEFGMYHGPFAFTVTCEGTVENPEDFDGSQADALTVTAVTYDGIGDATADVLDAGIDEDSDDGQNPVMNYIGEYQCDRAHALVEAWGVDGYTITIEWGDSARSLAKWVIESSVDVDTMTSRYYFAEKTYVTYDENGEVESEELLSDECSGTITFNEDWTFTWHDDQSEYEEDMVFEWLPMQGPEE